MSKAILICFHKYTPHEDKYYEPILDFFIASMNKYKDEYDRIYFIDSNWNINPERIKDLKAEIIKVNPSLRYYDAYKLVLPQVKEDLVLFMDNDVVIYEKGKIKQTLDLLAEYDVVSIYDTIGEYKTDKLNGKNKFCPYWFATRKELLMKYLNVDWSPDHMPYTETFGLLTEAMLNDGVKPYEWEEDKESIYFGGSTTNGWSLGKNLGYYHIRSGSTPAVLLSWKANRPEEYWDYIKNQPADEYIRHCAWYKYLGGDPSIIYHDCYISTGEFDKYYEKFIKYHGL